MRSSVFSNCGLWGRLDSFNKGVVNQLGADLVKLYICLVFGQHSKRPMLDNPAGDPLSRGDVFGMRLCRCYGCLSPIRVDVIVSDVNPLDNHVGLPKKANTKT